MLARPTPPTTLRLMALLPAAPLHGACCPLVPALQSRINRFLWLSATQSPWQRTDHAAFPPTFRMAARELLLAAHRLGTSGCGCCATAPAPAPGQRPGSACRDSSSSASARSSRNSAAQTLGHLPVHVLDEILQMAAYPLSTWAAAPWEAAAAWLRAWHAM